MSLFTHRLSSMETEAGAEAEVMMLASLVSMVWSACFLIQLNTAGPQVGTTPSGQGTSVNQENATQACLQANLAGAFSWLAFPLPRWLQIMSSWPLPHHQKKKKKPGQHTASVHKVENEDTQFKPQASIWMHTNMYVNSHMWTNIHTCTLRLTELQKSKFSCIYWYCLTKKMMGFKLARGKFKMWKQISMIPWVILFRGCPEHQEEYPHKRTDTSTIYIVLYLSFINWKCPLQMQYFFLSQNLKLCYKTQNGSLINACWNDEYMNHQSIETKPTP